MKSVFYMMLMSVFLLSTSNAAPPKGKATSPVAKPVNAAEPAKGNALLGRDKAEAERCIECHGVDGNGANHANGTEGKFAKLAGQYPAYILKQIRDFRSGARKHDQMAIMARSVSDEDVLDIAAYFASQPRMTGEGGDTHQVGKTLFDQGDPGRGIVACASCHGEKGKGLAANPLAPVIGGQEWRYMEKQMLEWRSGERRNSPDGVMNNVTKALTDAELASLVNHLSGL